MFLQYFGVRRFFYVLYLLIFCFVYLQVDGRHKYLFKQVR